MKFFIYGPSFGWFISQSYKGFELRRNNAAARRSNGVVGNTGRKMPRMPSPRERRSNAARKISYNKIWIAKIRRILLSFPL